MNFFSSNAFLESAQIAFYQGENTNICSVNLENRTFRTLCDENLTPLSRIPFLDYMVPVTFQSDATQVRFLNPVGRDIVKIGATQSNLNEIDGAIAPLVEWGEFRSFNLYTTSCRGRAFKNSKNKLRKLQSYSDVKILHNIQDKFFIEKCMEWKGQQYRNTGFLDLTKGGMPILFNKLHKKRMLLISALILGEQPIAIHLGVQYKKQFYYWIPAYDPNFAKYSPGTLLLEDLLRFSFESNDHVFDFMEGNEPYKLEYATHVRFIGTLGNAPVFNKWINMFRSGTANWLKRFFPSAFDLLHAARNYWRQKRIR